MSRAIRRTTSAALPGDPTVDYAVTLPYGYQPQDGVIAPTDTGEKALNLIFQEAADHVELEDIVRELNDNDVPPPHGHWRSEDVRVILTNPVYAFAEAWQGFGEFK